MSRQALLALIFVPLMACGGEETPLPTISVTVTNESCNPGCAAGETIYTFSVLDPGPVDLPCILQSKSAPGPATRVSLEGVPIAHGQRVDVFMTVHCKKDPECYRCYAESQDGPFKAGDGQTATLINRQSHTCGALQVPAPCAK